MALYAGFDCSTQSLSVVVIDAVRRSVVYRDSLPFDEPFVASRDGAVVHASPRTWTAALETIAGRLAREIDRGSLGAISGSAQQHGSVYCGDTADALTRPTAPIWMDSSTARECAEIEAALGGSAQVARLTGSPAHPRFTGPQIRKFARQEPDAYARTVRIHLVSSFLASILLGEHAPIDHADGSGMNLMDIRSGAWSPAALDATAPGLAGKLPPLVRSSTVIGRLKAQWQARLGLPPARIVAWSGDNPCSLVGTGLIHEGQLAISLGTSDTIFGPMREPRVSRDGTGHVFASPLGEYMGITVFRNGSLARQRVRDEHGLTWEGFSEALRRTPAGNDGAMMLPWFEPEITPAVPGGQIHRFGLETADPRRHVRAIVEAQIMAMARHSAWMGVTPRAIYATGGAAANREILQIIADVFEADVHRFASTDAAALGAALRALHADSGQRWEDVVEGFVTPVADSCTRPDPEHVDMYRRLRPLRDSREALAITTSIRWHESPSAS
ncbi:MAG: FGGY family carbohydrate kinase [Vicinamibacterales bacterium]